jgi:WD40 repeat protein
MRRGQRVALGCGLAILVPIVVLGVLAVLYASAAQPAWAVAWSADGKLLAAGYGGYGPGVDNFMPIKQDQDTNVRLWNTDRLGEDPAVLRGHTRMVLGLAFSPDSQLLASGEEFGRVLLWDAHDPGHAPLELAGDNASGESLAFSPDGSRLAGTGGLYQAIGVWDMRGADHRLTATYDADVSYFYNVSWAVDGQQIAAAASDGRVRFWDTATLGTTPNVLPDNGDGVFHIALDPTGRWLAGVRKNPSTVELLELHSAGADPIVLPGARGELTSVTFSPDGKSLAATTSSDSDSADPVLLWDLRDPQAAPRVLGNNAGRVQAVAFSPDGQWLATASRDGSVRVWNLSGGAADSRTLRR